MGTKPLASAHHGNAMQGDPVDWDAWKAAVREADSLVQMRQLLGQLEAGVTAAWLSPMFQRDPCLVKGVWLPTGELPLACTPSLIMKPDLFSITLQHRLSICGMISGSCVQ